MFINYGAMLIVVQGKPRTWEARVLKSIDEANNLEPDASSDKFLSTVDLYKTSIEWFSCHTQLTEV